MVRAIDSGRARPRRAGGEADAETKRARVVRDEAAATRPTRSRRSEAAVAAKPGAQGAAAAGTGKRARRGVLSLFVVAIALPSALALGATAYFDLRAVILPGVQVGGVPVQGYTAEQASAELERVWNQELRLTAVDVSEPMHAWLVAPGEFGLRVNPDESAALAYAAGRDLGLLEELLAIWNGLTQAQEIAPVVEFDPLVALAAYERWSPGLAVLASDAGLSLDSGEVRVAAGAPGRELDVLASLEWLAGDPRAALLDNALIPLVTRPVEPGIPEVDAQVAEVERLLTSQPTVAAYDPVTDEWFRWSPDRGRIASWIRIQAHSAGVAVELDQTLLQEYVGAQAEELGPERAVDLDQALKTLQAGLQGTVSPPLIIRYLPREHVVRAGETLNSIGFAAGIPYWKWLELNPQVRVGGLVVGETLAMPPKDAMLELPVVPHKRVVVSLAEQHMWMYQDGGLIADHVVSTGIPRSPTMPGIFQVKSHYLEAYASNWDLYMPHFLGIYDATPGFENGFHGLPLLSNGVRLWGNVLGRPASYGCIILTLEAAEHLYDWAEEGVVVEIRR